MATTVAPPEFSALPDSPARSRHPARPTPARVRLIAGLLTVALLALMAVTAAAFLQTRARAQTVSSRATTAVAAGDLYFALADLDAEAARLVLLGDGDFQAVGDGEFAGNQLSALTAYNARTAQVDQDLQVLAGADGAQTSALAAEVTQYRSMADAAIGLDEYPGAFAGSPTPTAIGFYGRAETLMHEVVLKAAEKLRDRTADASTSAAADAHAWALAGLIGTLLLGVVAAGSLVVAQRKLAKWYRRLLNPALLLATVVVVALVGGAAVALVAASQDANAAGTRLTAYLQVVGTRADSYDVDGAAVRSVLMPFLDGDDVTKRAQTVIAELDAPGSAGRSYAHSWQNGPATDYADIHADVVNGDVADALSVETGTARHEDAFDFFDYDLGLQKISSARLTAFQQASDGLMADLGPWLWLPWAMAGAALLLVGLGIRPRLAEYR